MRNRPSPTCNAGWLISSSQQYFARLADRDGAIFATWDDFVQYPEPYGLGMRADVVAAIMVERDKRKLPP